MGRPVARLLIVAVLLASAWVRSGWAQYGSGPGLSVAGLDSVRSSDAVYIGAQACRTCHEAAYQTWLGTGHARSWVFLGTPVAEEVGRRHLPDLMPPPGVGLAATLPHRAECLRCHAAAADVEPEMRTPDFHLEEGVQCEACHGPGSMHVRHGLVVAGQALRASRMEVPQEAECRRCHTADRPSHDLLGRRPFDYPRDHKRIAHPMSSQVRMRLLREHPGAYLSIGLRTLLGHWSGESTVSR